MTSTQFNNAQLKAVRHFAGPALILAGPGSGKTLVITHRIKTLIEEHKIPPENILVVTFSKAAAMEMQERFEKLNMQIHTQPVFGTFHSIFFKILKAAYGYDSSNIIRESKKYEILKYEIEKYSLEYDDESAFIKKIISEISRVKNSLIPLDKFVSSVLSPEIFKKIFNSYNNILLSGKMIDFDDMLSMTYELLKARPDILKIWQNMYRFILVDEFQDINRIQYETVKLLAGKNQNLFVVGDDDQSIYGFRGARPGIMFSFQKDFPNASKILLNINYRSRKLILSKSQQLISENANRMNKEIEAFKGNQLTAGEIFSIRSFDTQEEQYEAITDEIYVMKEKGDDLSEVAILFRNNFDSSVMAEKLAKRNIPFTVRDIPENIFRHFIALDLMAYIRLGLRLKEVHTIIKPPECHHYPDIRSDLFCIINKPLRYISRASIDDEMLLSVSKENFSDIQLMGSRFTFSSAEIYFKSMKKYYAAKPYMLTRINIFEEHLKFIGGLTPFAAIEYIRKAVGYEDYLKSYSREKHTDSGELISTLDAVQESAKNFVSFNQWFDYIDRFTEELSESSKKESGKPAKNSGVQLMTMHSSKGLEFDTVYIPNVNRETIPIRKAVSKEEVSEERRLFYVAMTRARDHLKISYVNHMRNRKIAPSEFLECLM